MIRPRVTIGLPVYNGARYLADAIDSLLLQSFSDFELIISDNASTDETGAICQAYAARDARIRYVRQPENIGAIGNFAYVLDQAVGDFFMWATHDDRRDPHFLEFALQVFDAAPETGLVFCDMTVTDLQTGLGTRVQCSTIRARNRLTKYLYRLLADVCPSLIYGLHRIDVLRRFNLESYDYMDIHLTHWYEINSGIRIIPLPLYTAGTDGERVPYSLTGTRIDCSRFLATERSQLRVAFSPILAFFLFALVRGKFRQKDRILNRIIKEMQG
jgi:glycosyltransferase involved in cell wall biosynthesis